MIRRSFDKTADWGFSAFSVMPRYALSSIGSNKVRMGFIGVGGRKHMKNMALRNDVIVPAICNVVPEYNKIYMAGLSKPHQWENFDTCQKK